MKRHNPLSMPGRILELAFVASLALALTAPGCKLRQEAQAEAAQQAADQKAADEAAKAAQKAEQEKAENKKEAEEEAEKAAKKQEEDAKKKEAEDAAKHDREQAQALEKAKTELRYRIGVYNALAGDYYGTYLAKSETLVGIKVHVSTTNVPAPAEIDLMTRESDVLARAEAIAVDVQTEESLVVDPHSTVYCAGMNLKGDFAQGMLRFDCSGQGVVAAKRVYELDFDSGDLKAMANETPETAAAISAELGNDLVSGKVTSLGGFRLSILMNPEFGYKFTGALRRGVQPAANH